MGVNRTVTLLGNFDGVHLGHRALIDIGRREADRKELPLTVWTFDALPTPAITPLDTRIELLSSCGVDNIVLESFDKVRNLSPSDFVSQVLCEKLNTSVCVCGYNYSFGYGGKGDASLLSKLCSEKGIRVIVADRVTKNGHDISSSIIRVLLSDGRMEEAALLLGRPYFCFDTVQRGAAKGRTVGMPTVNFYFTPDVCLPKNGVYATVTHLENGRSYPSVTNVGYRPTLNDGRGISVETHIPDFFSELYGTRVKVDFVKFLREEKKFSSLTELSEAVKKDILKAKEISLRALSRRNK